MKISVYGKNIDTDHFNEVFEMMQTLVINEVYLFIHENVKELAQGLDNCEVFYQDELIHESDLVLSIGGDGTILKCLEIVRSNRVPVLGINTGRLGFLSHVGLDEIPLAVDAILNGKLNFEERSLIELISPDIEMEYQVGLNEISILKKDTSSMITVHAYINGEYFSTYWADGLILSTPTGSTGYSLSCGGPIVSPGSGNFIITPVAPHNLNVRPLIIPDNQEVTLKFNGRSEEFLIAVDSNHASLSKDHELTIKKADYPFVLARLERHSFSNSLKSKLMWGMDKRNE